MDIYHGTDYFGFLEPDATRGDDGISFFTASDASTPGSGKLTAGSYIYNPWSREVKNPSYSATNINYENASDEQILDVYKKLIDENARFATS